MAHIAPHLLSDRELLAETARAADAERCTTADLLALLAELDSRRLYLGQGYSSLFTYCTQALRLSESAAYSRITAARAARRLPVVLTLIADGEVTLTTVSLLAAHLTEDNHDALLGAARHRSRRDVEQLVASLTAQPEIPTCVRKIPTAQIHVTQPHLTETRLKHEPAPSGDPAQITADTAPLVTARTGSTSVPGAGHRPAIAPFGPDRYLLRITLTGQGRQNLDRARDLLRHTIPSGDPAVIVERALVALVDQLERTKLAATSRPRGATTDAPRKTRGRHIPAAVKRAVWARDEGRCAFIASTGRCTETGFLEFHHVEPFAAGGPADLSNLQLRCRAHNQHESEIYVGRGRGGRASRAQPM